MTMVAEDADRAAQPVQAVLAGQPGGLLPQAADGPGADRRARRRDHRHHRLPVRRGADAAAARAARRGAPGRRGLPRHLRPGQLLPGADGPRTADRAVGPRGPAGHRPAAATCGRLATNDSHYVSKDQAEAHSALLCVQSGKTLNDPNRFKFDGDGYYLKSAEEMRAYWDKEVPGAADSTLLIAERVRVLRGGLGAPRPDAGLQAPEGHDVTSWFRAEVHARPALAAAGRRAGGVRPAGRVRDRRHRRRRGFPPTS